LFYPSELGYNTFSFEDKWPKKGDYDMNDLVVNFQYTKVLNAAGRIKEVRGRFILRARGATFRNAFGLAFDGLSTEQIDSATLTDNSGTVALEGEPGHSSAVTFIMVSDVHSKLPNTGEGGRFYNVENSDIRSYPLIDFRMVLQTALNSETFPAFPFKPFIYRYGQRGLEIHLIGNAPTELVDNALFDTEDDASLSIDKWYSTSQGLPWGIEILGLWKHPIEGISIGEAYPDILDWALSNGATHQNWSDSPVMLKVWNGD
jgi:LruC domain-containing protein